MNLMTPGTLLIAPPAIPDRRFSDAVLMITHHYRTGAFALCVNQPSEHQLQDLLEELEIEANLNFPVYWGGPVATNTVWMLHDAAWELDNTVVLNQHWSMTSNIEMFYHLADGDYPQQFRIMMGYCSWAPGQLEAELRGTDPWGPQHSWLTAACPDPNWLLEQPVDELWDRATELAAQQAMDTWL